MSSRTPFRGQTAAYELGRIARARGEDAAFADPRFLPQMVDDDSFAIFWQAGEEGAPLPRWVRGIRYRAVPEDGRSWNSRDKTYEPGVSVARIVGERDERTQDDLSLAFIRAGEPTIHVVEGWYSPTWPRGGDGEPLLVDAHTVRVFRPSGGQSRQLVRQGAFRTRRRWRR